MSIRLIVGLGNPGDTYRNTRHNVGFWCLDALAAKQNLNFRNENKFHGDVARWRTDDGDVWLLKPSTYMNLSGQAVQAVCAYYKIDPSEVLVVHDELDLLPGTMKAKLGGGNAGHNGLKSISAQLNTPNFYRIRLGIGHPRTFGWAQQVADFVLSAPNAEHAEGIETMIRESLGALPLFVAGKVDRALQKINRFGTPKKETTAKKNEATRENRLNDVARG